MAPITLKVNGQEHAVEAEADTPLLWVLRDALGLTGAKYSCGIGQCGACTVLIDGQAQRSCVLPAAQAAGREIVTIEGLSPDGSHPLQKAWLAENVAQCGYCQPGQIMQAAALLAANPNPTDAEIEAAMAGNLCRCGTYNRIKKAIRVASADATLLVAAGVEV
jgi:aerobic-type carbon monoxide dehydrogenase small subunit (CoxS/CutS family)